MPIARFQMPDGRVGRFEVPEGTSPEQAQSMISDSLNQQPAKPETNKYNMLESGVQGVAQGASANFGDELMAGLTAPVMYAGSRAAEAFGGDTHGLAQKSLVDTYSQERQKIDAENKQAARDNPWSYGGGSVLGAVGTGVAGGFTKGGATIANSLRSGNLAARVAKGAIAGAASGELYGAGGANEGERLQGATQGGAYGALVGGAIPIVTTAVGAAKDAVAPFTQRGREAIVGRFLQKQALDPARIAAADAAEIIPGSQPTLGQASGDYGVLSLERGLRNTNPADFAARESANNAARNRALDAIAGQPEDIIAAKTVRQEAASPLYDKAKAVLVSGDDALKDIASRPSFKNAFARAQKLASERGESLVIGKDIPKSAVDSSILDSQGAPISKEAAAQSAQFTGKGLHYIKMALDDLLDSSPTSGIGKNEIAAINSTKNDLLGWLDNKIPEYGAARVKYAELSRPIEQMETLQNLKGRVMTSVPDPQTGYDYLSQAKISNVFQKNAGEMAKTLSPQQFKVMESLTRDLDRSAAINAPNIRALGSDTAQNLATKNMLSNIVGDNLANNSAVQTITRPVAWAYKIPEEKMRDLLVEAMLNPSRAKEIVEAVKSSKLSGLAAQSAAGSQQDQLRQVMKLPPAEARKALQKQ